MGWWFVDSGSWTTNHRPPPTNQFMRSITSRQNPMVARFRALADSADSTGARVLLDGVHLVRDAHESGHSFELAAVSSSRMASETEEGRVAQMLERSGVEVVQAMTPLTPRSRAMDANVRMAANHSRRRLGLG